MSRFRALNIVRQFLFHADAEGVAVPPLDGPLTPNDLLDDAAHVLSAGAVHDPAAMAAASDGRLFIVEDDRLLTVPAGGGDGTPPVLVVTLPGAGQALRLSRDERQVFVCVDRVGVVRVGWPSPEATAELVVPLLCPTDVDELPDGRLVITEGSDRHPAREWARDLLEKNARGRLLVVTPDGQQEVVASGLAFPAGVCVTDSGDGVLVTEAWSHSLSRYDLSRGSQHPRTVLWNNLAGYPGRIRTGTGGRYWLSVFALRTHLVELVLLEDEFRTEMMASIDPDYWIQPALRSLNSGLEPLQGGQLKKLGKMKPWAPARSYGLIIQLDAAGAPVASLHSRADADTHGVVVAQPLGDQLLFVSRAREAVMSVPVSAVAS